MSEKNILTNIWKIENWIDPAKISDIDYSAYWNNEALEKDNVFYVLDGDFSKMENYIKESGLEEDIKLCIYSMEEMPCRGFKGVGIDLGAGSLWEVPVLLNCGKVNIDKIYCVEYSKHRLLKIGPKVLEHYNIPADKITLVLGSFYELKLEDRSVDFVFLSQAFHHAHDPDRLFSEIKRVLKPQGTIIMIGEPALNLRNYIDNIYGTYIKHIAKFFISKTMPPHTQQKIFGKTFNAKTILPKLNKFFPDNAILGDHYYTLNEYHRMFSRHSFKFKSLKRPGSSYRSFILALS